MKVLIIDDLAPVALTYKAILVNQGYDVDCYTNPKDALRAIQAKASDYNLMITDIYMDNVNGVELINAMAQANTNARILTITGGGSFDQSTVLMDTARAQSDYMAFKPIHSGQLINMVENLLRQPKRTATKQTA